MSAIPLRDYLTSRPELLPSFETLRSLMRPGEEAMVTESQGHPFLARDYRVWLRESKAAIDADGYRRVGPPGRTMGKPATELNAAIANLIGKLSRSGRVPR